MKSRLILVIAEHDNQHFKKTTLPVLSAAGSIPEHEIHVLVAGYKAESVVEEISQIACVDRVLWVDDVAYENHLAENLADLVFSFANSYAFILAPATTFGKNFLPRVAALLDVDQISDVCGIQMESSDKITFVHPIYAGNALETVENNAPTKVLTIRTSAFNAAESGSKKAEVEKVSGRADLNLAQYLSTVTTPSERPDLTQAKIIVSGGRGFQTAEKFKQIEVLADKLHAAIGASRAAVDAGLAPNDYQVGQTGKIVAPNLYIALGISGAIQHLAGMKESRVIVAINKDPEAPIFKIATYGLVGDLFEIIPEFIAELDRSN
jgi:electron transfer flavoprotein alpha subunit